ncbi:sensor histidine kinase [Streptomyces qinzhouensis]|uniref:histidine kinase n=1 Tax=Streptomyces qinzhouensis TaxID=2599401 RepID=A0A5B8IMR2_9ACTN|nr:ATP-binding protein [Streptomyces qinzhouensis]QDY78789.1 sensor histidine kinase [Streptomyces qinzhouensis]
MALSGAGGVIVVAALLLMTAVTVALVYRNRALRAGARAADLATAADRFADQAVPALMTAIRQGSRAGAALAAVPAPENPAYQRVLRQIADEAERSERRRIAAVGEAGLGEKRRAAAMAACANAAGRMQAMTTGMLADLREMEHRHDDEDVLADLLHLDHRTAQAGRLADSIAVLSGARSGRRWAKPIPMESILRGAMGRVAGYQRVRIRSVADIAVAGHAAEGVMHVLAELLDNACNFSPPTTDVHGYVAEVPAGAVITVEDSGLVMGETALRRAERAVSGESGDLSTLTGTRLGLAVVGRLARKHGLTVSFRPSAIGGTGVVVMIPQELVTRSRPDEPQIPAGMRRGAAATRTTTAANGGSAGLGSLPGQRTGQRTRADHDFTPAALGIDPGAGTAPVAELPKRRRGRTLAATHPDGLPSSAAPRDDGGTARPQSAGAGARFGAFRRAVTGQEQHTGPGAGTTTPPATPLSEDDR